MKRAIAALFALAMAAGTTSHAQAQSPFCAVTAMGSQCHYYSLSACQQAVTGMDGACVANVQQPVFAPAPPTQPSQIQPVQIQHYDIAGAAQRGYAEGQRMRIERERHDAEMRALNQPQTIQHRPMTNDGYFVMYRCPDGAGG